MLKITLKKGLIGVKDTQKRVIKSLGLGKFGSMAFHADTPIIRGMIHKVEHLITVEVDGAQATTKSETKKK